MPESDDSSLLGQQEHLQAEDTPYVPTPCGMEVGAVVNGLTITGPGIQGGMGVVYPAMHEELREPRALKVLRRDLVRNAKAVERFREEARLATRLLHGRMSECSISSDGRTISF